nr:MAG TPA: hypothetical protein [Bacteriophage sp.]DAO26100.1 MAG TPA: hypothetical protein [Bacteriophage sp.]
MVFSIFSSPFYLTLCDYNIIPSNTCQHILVKKV